MNASALPLSIGFEGGASLGAVMNAVKPHAERRLAIRYDGQLIQPGYHVTEVKAGSFVALDCGGHPDAWQETILQIEDLPAAAGKPDHMPVGKLLAILEKVASPVVLQAESRLTFEVGPPGRPMQVFDLESIRVEATSVLLGLGPRPAICKPRHRAQREAARPSCCGPASSCR